MEREKWERTIWSRKTISGVKRGRERHATNLDVEGRRDCETNEDKEYFVPCSRNSLNDEAEPSPEEGDSNKFDQS